MSWVKSLISFTFSLFAPMILIALGALVGVLGFQFDSLSVAATGGVIMLVGLVWAFLHYGSETE